MSLARLVSGDTVTVTAYLGETAYGPKYASPVQVDGRVEADRKLVRNANGDEVLSETTIFVLPDVGAARAVDLFVPESVVTHEGRASVVIACNSRRGQAGPVYVEVVTT